MQQALHDLKNEVFSLHGVPLTLIGYECEFWN
jgi:hypothetical protein